jgi:hypothetical protein
MPAVCGVLVFEVAGADDAEALGFQPVSLLSVGIGDLVPL